MIVISPKPASCSNLFTFTCAPTLWDHLRENCFGNRVFPSLRAVVDCLCQGLNDLDSQPEVVKSLTCFDWIKALHLT